MTAVSGEGVERAGCAELLRLAPDASELGRVRTLAQRCAERFGLDAAECFRFKLAASEAAANAIEHGLPTEDGTIHVSASHDATTLVLQVRDGGEFKLGTGTGTAAGLADRGRGLPLMNALTDGVNIAVGDAGTTVSLLKRRPGPS